MNNYIKMHKSKILRVRVKGDYACFTRPTQKVERMTYPCMTPSAARGILEAILYKPEFEWQVNKIIILKPVSFTMFRRNELSCIQSGRTVDITDSKNRTQRHSVILRDVEYIIEATIYMSDRKIEEVKRKSHIDDPIKKYENMFNRRLENGQCWRRPCLGTREFSCEFFPVSGEDYERADELNLTYPIGNMLFDIWYDENHYATPIYMYNVIITQSKLICPTYLNERMLSSSHLHAKRSDFYNQVLYNFDMEEEDYDI